MDRAKSLVCPLTWACLAFDPAVSPHYEVFLIPDMPGPKDYEKQKKRRALRWRHNFDVLSGLASLFSLPDGHPEVIAEETIDEEFEFQRPMVGQDHDKELRDNDPCGLMEWPPSPWKMHVFSSRTSRWEGRSFIREGEPAGQSKTCQRCAVYGQVPWNTCQG